MTQPDLRLFLVQGMTPWYTKALRRQSRAYRDAHANSRRWSTPRQHSLYSDDNHLSPIVFFLEPRRGQETYQLDKQPACLLLAGYTNKIKANSGIRSWRFYRLSTRLPVCGNVARVALWGSFRLDAGWYPRLECFLADGWLGILFSKREDKRFVRIAVDRCFSRSQADTGSRPISTVRSYVSCWDERMSGNAIEQGAEWPGTLRSAWWRVRSGAETIRCFLHIVNTESPHLSTSTSVYCAGFRGVMF